ncbi:transmembrane-type terpene cyclase [Arthrobacter globiformis]|uniref:transmembrane-type terpene cyclase n=1 Tax=Arthrobacter globiformis TaxID=1665 RepID=UPI002790F84E|nr:hypothetical protein [Arthrobacter globiformis]MDQ0616038.1 putative neutral ceramidase superfamily lipid hydrolase [Arthrobacter globiformis]
MILFLTIVSGVAWTVVYVGAIRLGFRQRTYAIPAAALALNFAWEAIYAARSVATGISAQGVFNIVWGLADVLILYTFLRFGRGELPPWVTRPLFLAWAVLLGITSFAVQLLFVAEFGWDDATKYAAFLQNLLMSGLFIAMFVSRGSGRGQSLVIALAKWIGTLAPTIVYGGYGNSPLILGLGALCSVFDLAYIALLWRARGRATV